MGLRAGVDKLDSEDRCWSKDLNLAILEAKSAVSSYSSSGLSVPDVSSVDTDKTGRSSSLGWFGSEVDLVTKVSLNKQKVSFSFWSCVQSFSTIILV